jgi:hypothetical protein
VKRSLVLPLVVAALLGAPAARAQGTDLAAAQGLFDEAKRLVAQGKLAEACPKFLSSFKFDPKPGTALNLADCYEKTGQIASAWARYLETASLAQRAGQADRERYAKDHAAALEPRVSRLTITAPTAPQGLEVRRDGVAVDAAILGTALPVDPGAHVIEARAPGKKAWSRTVEIALVAGRLVVEIPPLEDSAPGGGPAPIAPPPAVKPSVAADSAPPPRGALPPPAAPASTSTGKALGLAAIGVGGAGVVVGAITGGLAVAKHHDLAGVCTAGVCMNQSSAIDSYHTLGTVADVGLIVGGALAVTGIVLVVTAPRASAARQAWVAPLVGPGFAGATGGF